MHIAIDIQPVLGKRSGVGWYAFHLVKALSRIDKNNKVILFYFDFLKNSGGIPTDNPRFKNHPIYLPRRVFNFAWKKLGISSVDFFVRADVFHFPNFVIPPLKKGKAVVTIHDLAFRRYPEYIEPKNLSFLTEQLPRTLKRADSVIVNSEFTKNELISFYDIVPEKVRVTRLGVSEEFRPVEEPGFLEETRKRYQLPKRFILSLGTLEPRKNVPALLKAYSRLRQSPGFEHKLVFAGMKGWLYDGIFEQIKRLNLENQVLFIGYVPEEDLPFLYNLSELFVFPSLYEGFGLPVLEAFACGVPVIVSDRASLPEVAGDAAILIDPEDIDALTRGMKNVLGNEDLRTELIAKGFRRAKEFSWEKTARETLRVYEEVVGDK